MSSDGRVALESVIAAVGGQSALARLVGCTQTAVWKWTQKGHVPLAWAAKVQRAAKAAKPPMRVTQAALAGLDEDSP